MEREQQYYILKSHLLRFEMLKVVLCSADRNIITVNIKSFLHRTLESSTSNNT
jgi:hypothetical protein